MKIQMEIDEQSAEEVIIRCRELTPEIRELQKIIRESTENRSSLVFYKGETRVYLSLEEILFFVTEPEGVQAHTAEDDYQTRYRLYELEELLPRYFMRVSKSTILNTREIFSIEKNLYSSSSVMFRHSHKQVYVSRRYYKLLIDKLDEKRVEQRTSYLEQINQ